MILTDGVHLVSDRSLNELLSFGHTLGLSRSWLQDRGIPHYDLYFKMADRAIAHGAQLVSRRQLVKRAIRKEQPPA